MKKLLITLGLIVIFCQCCSNKPKEISMKVQVKIIDKLSTYESNARGVTLYSISIDLINNTDSTFSFWIMSCSWQDNWIFNSDSVRLYSLGCDSNFPVLKQIPRGQKLTFIGTLQVLSPFKTEKEKFVSIGFVEIKQYEYIINSDFRSILFTKIKEGKNIIWSDKFNIQE